MKPSIMIGNTIIEKRGTPYFIADIAANHDGDIDRALKLIELAKESGADAAKFQNFKADLIVSKNGFELMPRQTHQAEWKKSVYEVYEDASLKEEWTELLKKKCDEVGIEYMTSPYDFDSADAVDPYSNAFKIGSGDITWTDMLAYVAKKRKPVILATGASSIEDVERAVNTIRHYNQNLVLMQCNTNYTADKGNYQYINLNVLNYYDEKYPECILGLSDHTFGYATVLGAIAFGASVIEKHFTDDNGRIGPDHKFAMNPRTWKEMVNAASELYESLGDGIKKVEENEREARIVQQRAFYTTRNLREGTEIQERDIYPLRPFKEGGIAPYNKERLVGKILKRALTKDTCIMWEDLNDA